MLELEQNIDQVTPRLSRRDFLRLGIASLVSAVVGWESVAKHQKPKELAVTIPPKMRLDLSNIPMWEWSLMVSEMKRTGSQWNSTIIGKNFDNLKDTWGIASLTKIMTALVVYELCREKWLDPKTHKIRIEKRHVPRQTPGSAKKPSLWTVEEAVDWLVMKSHNTLANALASSIVPEQEFIRRMNATALRIWMNNTVYITPSWLNKRKEWNRSTEIDLQRLVEYTLAKPYPVWSPTQYQSQEFSVSQVPRGQLSSADKIFLDAMDKHYPSWDVIGTKTGYTRDAWKCVITIVKNKKTGKVYSMIWLNMTRRWWKPGDSERRRIRFKILDKLEGLV